jgi:AraC family transcriptional activator of tynA and feaB
VGRTSDAVRSASTVDARGVRSRRGGSGPEVEVRWIDDVGVVRWTAPPFRAVPGPRHVAQDDHEYAVVDMVDHGRLQSRQARLDLVVDAGGAVAWESARPVRIEAPELAAGLRLVVPAQVVTDVRRYLEVLDDVLTDTPGPAAAVAARNALLELVWGALQPDMPLDPLALLPARRAAVDRYLDSHLENTGLSADRVAAVHSISTRSLSRLFQATGETFGRVLTATRLARVREDLLTRTSTVESAARRWGFITVNVSLTRQVVNEATTRDPATTTVPAAKPAATGRAGRPRQRRIAASSRAESGEARDAPGRVCVTGGVTQVALFLVHLAAAVLVPALLWGRRS